MARRKLTKQEYGKLRAAFVFGWSLGSISEATGLSRGTLSAYASRNGWWKDRPGGIEILRKTLRRKNEI